MSSFSTSNKKNANKALNPNLSTEMDDTLSIEQFEAIKKKIKKNKKRKAKNNAKKSKRQKTAERSAPPNVSASLASAFSSDSLVNAIPIEIWRDEICTNLGYFDRSNGNATCNEFNDTFQKYNQKFLKKNAIHVPQDVKTIEKAMELVAKLQMSPTEKDPLRIVLDKGVHEIFGNCFPDSYREWQEWGEAEECGYKNTLKVRCSHITFVGKGKDQTTILGTVRVKNQQGVKFEELSITNPDKEGLYLLGRTTTVDMLKCALNQCGWTGMVVDDGPIVTATQCDFMNNGHSGVMCSGSRGKTKVSLHDCTIHHNSGYHALYAYHRAVVNLHGTKTDIHSNTGDGILTGSRGQVNIHLPSNHNTTHDNGREDRGCGGWNITNINTDGTFTPVVFDGHIDPEDWSDEEDWSDSEAEAWSDDE